MFNLKNLVSSEVGRILISIVLGLGLATLFRKACNDRSCIVFKGPMLDQVNERVYQYGDECYEYNLKPTKCDPTKHIVPFDNPVVNKVIM